MQTIAALSLERLWIKGSKDPVSVRNGTDHIFVGNIIVCGSKRIRRPEIDLILSRTGFMVGRFRLDAHFFQGQADLSPDVFSTILWRNVQISTFIPRNIGRSALIICLKELKLTPQSHTTGKSHIGTFLQGIF